MTEYKPLTEVQLLPYEECYIEGYGFYRTDRRPAVFCEVEKHPNLVEIMLPEGESIILRADEVIEAVKKCSKQKDGA